MCKIKTDPLSFDSVQDFESLFTNLRVIDTTDRKELDYEDLLSLKIGDKKDRQARRLLAEGEAGAGKTTLCAKIAWDWLNGNGFKQFELVLIFPLRDTENNKTVGEIAKAYFSDHNTTSPEQFEKYCYENPDKVFIVFDGLDEFKGDISNRFDDIIVKTLRSEHLLLCIILVTTRPWRADHVKGNTLLKKSYRFIRVEGFRKENIPVYIKKFFASKCDVASGLIAVMEENEIVAENMAPYPIYTAMLCIFWRESSEHKRQIIRQLQTFSQLFEEMVSFLSEHCFSKGIKSFTDEQLQSSFKRTRYHLQEIGRIAFEGLLKNELSFPENRFRHCQEAVTTGCKVGVISQEKRVAPKQQRETGIGPKLLTTVLFPHKLFQEYLAALYIASLYDSSRSEFDKLLIKTVLPRAEELQYVLFFTVSRKKDLGLCIMKQITTKGQTKINRNLIVDLAFECQYQEAATMVDEYSQTTSELQEIEVDDNTPSTHTVFGYFFSLNHMVRYSRTCYHVRSAHIKDDSDMFCEYNNHHFLHNCPIYTQPKK